MNRDPRLRERNPDANYDAADDLRRSVEFAYEAIRERVARGGHGWCGWPEPVAFDAARTCARPAMNRHASETHCRDDCRAGRMEF
jgi:hypothetical protein